MKKKKESKQTEIIIIVGLVFVLSIVALNINASTITHEFKNPSFSGIATSGHYLTIDEQETKRRDELAEEVQSALEEIQRDIDNSTNSCPIYKAEYLAIYQETYQTCYFLTMVVLVEP